MVCLGGLLGAFTRRVTSAIGHNPVFISFAETTLTGLILTYLKVFIDFEYRKGAEKIARNGAFISQSGTVTIF